jgi:hypothetical protein
MEFIRRQEMNELKRLIKEAKELHEASLDDGKPEDETDAAYAEYWKRLEKIADILCSISGGKIDRKTALRMAAHKADQILDLVNKAA